MCGILGIVRTDDQQITTTDRRILRRLLDTLSERGPDGAGFTCCGSVGLGHRRLAIRDRRQGAQPWSSPDGSALLVYNGELYNDQALRRELSSGYRFETRCDTETLMAAYLRWGRACVHRLRGMFAFGIYDVRDRSLWLVRDRFGVKPLYHARIGDHFVFASRVATIVEHPGFSKQPDWDVVSHYLSTTRLTIGGRTIYQGLSQLQPAEELILQAGRTTLRRYWEYPSRCPPVKYIDAVDELEEALDDCVRMRLASDVPVGMFLSGGVDSSTIASLVSRNHPSSRYAACATTSDPETSAELQDELSFANRCATEIGFELEPITVSSGDYLHRWHELVTDGHLPLSTPSDVMIYEMSRAAKREVGVVLGGEGSDELFCGYAIQHWSGFDYDAAKALHGNSAGGENPSLLRSIISQYGRSNFRNETDHYFALNSLMPPAMKAQILNSSIWASVKQDAATYQHYQSLYDGYADMPTVEKNSVILHRVNLESLLARLDMTTMHAGLEARVPFTDHVLVEKAFRLPFAYCIHARPTSTELASAELAARGQLRPKRILRAVARRLLPHDLANRQKASFPTGVQIWLQQDWRTWISHYLANSPFAMFLLSPDFFRELTQSPAMAGMWLWPLLNLAIWGDAEFF